MRPIHDQVGIFGVGLLGGSVAMALRERTLAGRIHGYDPSPEARQGALERGACDEVHAELGPWVGDLDLGVLAAPVGTLVKLGRALAPLASPHSLWTDLGSVKAPVTRALTGVLPGFVGGHPMAGAEQAGVRHARPRLAEDAVWVLTPVSGTPAPALAAIRSLVERLGATPLEVPPELHDRLVARVSHLPYLMAVALTMLVAEDDRRDLLGLLAAGGFRDTTRVVSGSPEMSRDMLFENRAAVLEAKRDLEAVVARLEQALDDPEALLQHARAAKDLRDALPIVKRSLAR
jgi:prephenate dehydrogenase